MRRTICLWLLACLALGSAGPLPVPASQEELMEMILNAKPEDNDIGIQSDRPQPSENVETESQDTVVTGDSDLQKSSSEKTEEELNNAAEEDQHSDDEPETKPEVEPVVEPGVEPMVESEVELDPSSQETEYDRLPELTDSMPFTEELSNPDDEIVIEQPVEEYEQTEEIIPVLGDQRIPVSYFDENGNLAPEEEQTFFEPEVVEADPFPEQEQIYGIPDEEVEIPIDQEEQFPLIIDEQIPIEDEVIPVDYEEESLVDTEYHPYPEVAIVVNSGNEQIAEEPEEVIVVGLEEEVGQPIYAAPMIPGFIADVPQPDDTGIFHEEDESIFGSFMTPNMEELPQTDIVSMDEESQAPVYFEMTDDEDTGPEVFSVEMPDVSEIEAPAEMPLDDMAPFEVSDMEGNPLTSEIPSEDVYPVIPVNPVMANIQPIVDYYIPEAEDSEEADDLPLSPILVREVIGDNVPFKNEPQVFDDAYFTPENIDSLSTSEEVLEEADISDELQESGFPLVAMLNENFPIQSNVEQEEAIFVIEPEALNDEETIIEIIPMENNPPNPDSLPVGVEVPLTDFIKTDPMNFEIPEEHPVYPTEEIEDEYEENNSFLVPQQEEDDSYLLPQQPIIFPEERPLRHNLPVFLDQWDEEDYYQHPISGRLDVPMPIPSYFSEPSMPHGHLSDSSYYNPVPSQGPSYGNQFMQEHPTKDLPSYFGILPFHSPSIDSSSEESFEDDFPEDHFMIESPEMMVDDHDDEAISSQMTDIISPEEEPNMTIFGNEPLSENTEDNTFPKTDVYDNFRPPSKPLMIDDYISNDNLPLREVISQHDFNGPNTFPLNFQQPDFTPDFNPDTQRYNENIQESYDSPQQFPISDSSNSPNSMSLSPSVFLSLIGQAGNRIRNPIREHMNQQLQQGQYDVEVSFIPYETRYDLQMQDAPVPFNYGYPGANRPSSFYPVKGFPNNFQSYDGFFPYYQNSDRLYPTPLFQNRYNHNNYFYRNRYADYHPYNYPTPTW